MIEPDINGKGRKTMAREMRRKRQALDAAACDEILYKGTNGVLALCGKDGAPYAVPMSYVYDGENIYFHGAKQGHKLDIIAENPTVSFCVVNMDQIVPEKFTTFFKSVIVFGNIQVMTEDEEKLAAIRKLAKKYSPDETEEATMAEINSQWKPMCLLKLSPTHITGKQAIELVKG